MTQDDVSTGDPAAVRATPLHLWVIGALSLLWNCIGAFDYTMTQTHNDAYLANPASVEKARLFDVRQKPTQPTPRPGIPPIPERPVELIERHPLFAIVIPIHRQGQLLDVVGDLALIGVRIKGKVIANKPGHFVNTQFAKKMSKIIKIEQKNYVPTYNLTIRYYHLFRFFHT